MPIRRTPLVTGQVYHVFNRGVSKIPIFTVLREYKRAIGTIQYYMLKNTPIRYSKYLKLVDERKIDIYKNIDTREKTVELISYVLMPNHFHFLLKQVSEEGIKSFVRNFQISYTRYFNTQHKRKGPLWESRFKSVLVENDEQLQHLIRYLHLNPATARLVNHPEDWKFSSYKEYLSEINDNSIICQFDNILDINPPTYRKFVNDQISYQRELAKIKKLILD